MTRLPLAALAVAFAAPLVNCSQSPLLNHANAAPVGARAAINQQAPKAGPGSTADCPLSFAKAQLCASLTWTKQPADGETGSFELDFWDPAHGSSQGPYIDPSETVFVKLWMPDMGHGSSPVKVDRKGDLKGQFNATNVYFVMPGGWEIHVQLKNGSNVVDEVVLPIQI